MGYFPVRYDSRVVIYDRRGFIRLATGNRYRDPSPLLLDTFLAKWADPGLFLFMFGLFTFQLKCQIYYLK